MGRVSLKHPYWVMGLKISFEKPTPLGMIFGASQKKWVYKQKWQAVEMYSSEYIY